jgi:hypothetical protein
MGPALSLESLGMDSHRDETPNGLTGVAPRRGQVLWSDRLAAIYGRFEATLTIGGAVDWREAAWLASVATGIATLVRSRVALPVVVIALAFVVLPWLYHAGVWQAIQP